MSLNRSHPCCDIQTLQTSLVQPSSSHPSQPTTGISNHSLPSATTSWSQQLQPLCPPAAGSREAATVGKGLLPIVLVEQSRSSHYVLEISQKNYVYHLHPEKRSESEQRCGEWGTGVQTQISKTYMGAGAVFHYHFLCLDTKHLHAFSPPSALRL